MIFALITIISLVYIFFMIISDSEKSTPMNQILFDSLIVLAFFTVLLTLFQFIVIHNPLHLSYLLTAFLIRFFLFIESVFYINISSFFLIQTFEKFERPIVIFRRIAFLVSLVYLITCPLRTFAGTFYEDMYSWFLALFLSDRSVVFARPQSFIFLYRAVFPGISVLLLYISSFSNSVKRQKALLDIIAVTSLWFSTWLLYKACSFNRHFVVFVVAVYISALLILIKTEKMTALFKPRFFIVDCIAIFLRYIIPALLCGAMFSIIYYSKDEFGKFSFLFYFLFVLVAAMLAQLLNDKVRLRTSGFAHRYKDEFELKLGKIDFSRNPKEITERFCRIFKDCLSVGIITIIVSDTNGGMKTVHNSTNKIFRITDKDVSLLNKLLDMQKDIVFISDIGFDDSFTEYGKDVENLLNKTSSRVLLILHQGDNMIGAIFLGAKSNGHRYNSYDRMAFADLNSYFFVYAYFMQNFLNRSVVEIFDREVRLSSQVISSVQQNMDFPNKDQIDYAYKIIPAHEIGGEFIDMVKLSETKHLFVLGSLSGKGVSASMNMVILRNTIRNFVKKFDDVKNLTLQINDFILHHLPKETFFSGIFISVDHESGMMRYINCGVPAFFMYVSSLNNVMDIQGKGCILGMVQNINDRLAIKEQHFNKGDIICACTAGVMVASSPRGEEFGRRRTRRCIADRYEYSSDQIVRHIINQLDSFTANRIDNDITLLVLER